MVATQTFPEGLAHMISDIQEKMGALLPNLNNCEWTARIWGFLHSHIQ